MSINPTSPVPIRVIENAHNDDIHGMIYHQDSIITGSKDTTIKRWSSEGELIQVLYEDPIRNYSRWITALCTNGKNWISGNRYGKIIVWDGSRRKYSITFKPPRRTLPTVCKQRNVTRINCLSFGLAHNILFGGSPKYVHVWNLKKNRFLEKIQVDRNDWVYDIQHLSRQQILLVIGSRIEAWKRIFLETKRRYQWLKQEELFSEYVTRTSQRPHISATTFLTPQILAFSVFDGSIKFINIENSELINNYHEHKGRAWTVCRINRNSVASGADDGCIRIWDSREENSIKTFPNHPGRVSNIIKISENILVAGTCPDNPFNSEIKGCLYFWDLRL